MDGWLVFILGLIALVIKTGECLKCLQCTTLLPHHECETGSLEPKQCGKDDAYCIKYVGKLSFGDLVFRDCTDTELGDVCEMKMIEGSNVIVCYETCQTDGCNGGLTNGASSELSDQSVSMFFGLLLAETSWIVCLLAR